MTVHPDLDDLEMLVLVAETGSIGKAAAQLGLTQPSVSRRLAALERSMRVQLLQRGPRGSVLTPSGKVVIGWATTLLDSSAHFTRSVQTMRDQRVAGVRVAASMTIAEHLAPVWLAQLRAQSSETVVSLVVDNSTEVADAVENGAADIGFVESPTIRGSLRRRRLMWDTLVVAVRPDHPWARRSTPISATELASEPLLVRETGSGTRETLDEAMEREHLEIIPLFALASNSGLKSSALAGIGPAVLSRLTLAGELTSGRLVEVPVEGMSLRRPLSAVWRKSEKISPAAAEFLFVAEAASD